MTHIYVAQYYCPNCESWQAIEIERHGVKTTDCGSEEVAAQVARLVAARDKVKTRVQKVMAATTITFQPACELVII